MKQTFNALNTETRRHDSTEAEPWQLCIDASTAFYKSLQFGRVRGVALLDGGKPNQYNHMDKLIQELIFRDILVVVSGLEIDFPLEAGDGLSDVCDHIGIEPVISSVEIFDCREGMKFFQMLSGLAKTHISQLPIVTASNEDANNFKRILEIPHLSITEAPDVIARANLLDDYLHTRRLKLNWCDRYHC